MKRLFIDLELDLKGTEGGNAIYYGWTDKEPINCAGESSTYSLNMSFYSLLLLAVF